MSPHARPEAHRAAPALARAALCGLLALCAGSSRAGAQAAPEPLLDEEGFVRASAGRPLRLPEDHGSHPETRTEWWYLTGLLHAESPDGAPQGLRRPDAAAARPAFGFQATWFRRALVRALPEGRSPLAARDVMLYHGALTDIGAGTLALHEQTCRTYAPWAHAATDGLDIALLGNALAAAPGLRSGQARLRCRVGGGELDVLLDWEAAEPLLHGIPPGLSRKGELPGQASWYYSLPRIPLRGTLRRPGRPDLRVSGQAWFDHEFGSGQLSAGQVGWDWFSVALDDGSDLMLYRLRLADGAADGSSSGTFRTGSGSRHLARDDFDLSATGTWTSPRTGARYPSGWVLSVPGEELRLQVTPLVADQELLTPGSTGITYWEGACRFDGTRAGVPVRGEGYVELVGYAGGLTQGL